MGVVLKKTQKATENRGFRVGKSSVTQTRIDVFRSNLTKSLFTWHAICHTPWHAFISSRGQWSRSQREVTVLKSINNSAADCPISQI